MARRIPGPASAPLLSNSGDINGGTDTGDGLESFFSPAWLRACHAIEIAGIEDLYTM